MYCEIICSVCIIPSLENDSPSRGRKLAHTDITIPAFNYGLENDSPSRGRKRIVIWEGFYPLPSIRLENDSPSRGRKPFVVATAVDFVKNFMFRK